MIDSKENKKSLIASLLEEISPKKSLRIENNMRIAANIADLLEKRGIGKVELARRLGKHASVATKWLSGTHNFTTETLSDICFELGTTMPEIHKEKEQPIVSVRYYDVHAASPLAGIIPRVKMMHMLETKKPGNNNDNRENICYA